MKIAIRSFVAFLVLTGVAATSQTPAASSHSKATLARTSMLPIPVCAPDDPHACGMGTH
jgi:hypothetical protein